MKKRSPSYTAGGNVNWWNTMKNSMEMEVTKKTKAVFFFSICKVLPIKSNLLYIGSMF